METAVAIKRFGWTNEQARSVYNASVSTINLIVNREKTHIPSRKILESK